MPDIASLGLVVRLELFRRNENSQENLTRRREAAEKKAEAKEPKIELAALRDQLPTSLPASLRPCVFALKIRFKWYQCVQRFEALY